MENTGNITFDEYIELIKRAASTNGITDSVEFVKFINICKTTGNISINHDTTYKYYFSIMSIRLIWSNYRTNTRITDEEEQIEEDEEQITDLINKIEHDTRILLGNRELISNYRELYLREQLNNENLKKENKNLKNRLHCSHQGF